MFFASSECDKVRKKQNPKRKGIKLFEHPHNQESLFSQNLTESPLKLQGRRVSLPEYNSVLSRFSCNSEAEENNQDLPRSETSEEVDSVVPISQYSTAEVVPSSRSSSLSINRGALDKVYATEKKRRQASDLIFQINEAQAKKELDLVEKEKEKKRALDEFSRFQEERIKENLENKAKKRNYKAQLDVQKAMIMDSRNNEKITSYREKHFELSVDHSIDSPNVGYFSNYGRYTKNSPPKLNFNPITGILKENPVKKNIFDSSSEASWNASRSFRGPEEKNRNLIGYGSIIVQNK
jgi:hypothetical protein